MYQSTFPNWMSSSRGTIGTVIGLQEKIKVEWIIPEFSNLSTKVDEFYDSTVFGFSDALWHLRIYPNGQARNHSDGHIGLYLMLLDINHQHAIDFTLGFGYAGELEGEEIVFSPTFSDCGKRFGRPKFLARSELMRRKAELLPGDTLATIAILSLARDRLLKASLFERLLRLSYNMMNLLKSKRNTDVRLQVDRKELAAHGIVLAARSEVFQKMLSHDMVERRTGQIKIEDIEQDVVRDLGIYMYSGRARVTDANARPLYVAADKYDLRGLRELCSVYMESNMSDELFCDAFAVAATYGEEELMGVCTKYLERHADTILESEKWKQFSNENIHMAFRILTTYVRMNARSAAQ